MTKPTATVDRWYQDACGAAHALELLGERWALLVVRELVLLDVPSTPLCRPDCAGLCLTCGANLNDGPCGCAAAPTDPRWSALDQLHDLADPGD